MRPESTSAPIDLLLFGPIRPPLVRLRTSVATAKLRAMFAPVIVTELTLLPPDGIVVFEVRRMFSAAVPPANVFVWSYWAAPVWFSAAMPRPGT